MQIYAHSFTLSPHRNQLCPEYPVLNWRLQLKSCPDAFPRWFFCTLWQTNCTETGWWWRFCPLLPSPWPQFCVVRLRVRRHRRRHCCVPLCENVKEENPLETFGQRHASGEKGGGGGGVVFVCSYCQQQLSYKLIMMMMINMMAVK